MPHLHGADTINPCGRSWRHSAGAQIARCNAAINKKSVGQPYQDGA